MKRIISLGFSGTDFAWHPHRVLMSAAYATVGGSTSSSSGTDDNETGGKPNIVTSDGILIESYSYSKRTLTLTLVDTNVSYQKGKDTFDEFYAALLTGNFYPNGVSDEKKDETSITTNAEILGKDGEKNLRFKVSFPYVGFDKKGTEAKFRMYYNYPSSSNENFYEYVVSADLSRYTRNRKNRVPPPPIPLFRIRQRLYPGAKLQLWRFGRGGPVLIFR